MGLQSEQEITQDVKLLHHLGILSLPGNVRMVKIDKCTFEFLANSLSLLLCCVWANFDLQSIMLIKMVMLGNDSLILK